MGTPEQASIEAEIGQILLDHWGPHETTEPSETSSGYPLQAHEVYSLLARGASDTQIARRLHQIERDDMQQPDLATRDLTPVMRTLRAIERRM